MLYRYFLTIAAVMGFCLTATATHAQSLVHDLIKERQSQARDYLQQDVNQRGDFVGERSAIIGQQENASIGLSRKHDAMLNTLDRTYDAERQKYSALPQEQQHRVFEAYQGYRNRLIEQQRQEMACNMMAVQTGKNAATCTQAVFQPQQLDNELNAVLRDRNVQQHTTGTLQPNTNTGVRIGGGPIHNMAVYEQPQRVANPTPNPPRVNPPARGGGGGGGGGGMLDRDAYHSMQMQ